MADHIPTGTDDAPRSWGEYAGVACAAFCGVAAAAVVVAVVLVSMSLAKG